MPLERPVVAKKPGNTLRWGGCVVIIHLMATIPEALTTAIRHHQAGRLQAAEQIYRQILAVGPGQAEALHLLGLISHRPAITN